jgi:hypothetical protein
VKYLSIFTLIATAFFAVATSAVDIQDAYDACGPAGGYDKYLELNPGLNYTGNLTADTAKDSYIKGNGAEIYIDAYGKILADGSSTKLDMDHVVINGHGSGNGVNYSNGAKGIINFCTINNFMDGLYVWGVSDATLKNSIVTNNSRYAVAKEDIASVRISYVDVWGNSEGNYYQFCNG